MIKYTQEQVLNIFNKIYGTYYDYSKVNYISVLNKVIVICKIHGEFEVTPSSHFNNHGCPKCGQIKAIKNKSINYFSKFLEKSKNKFGDKYNYSLVNFDNKINKKIKIICPIHGEISMTPQSHLRGTGCDLCGQIKIGIDNRLSKEDFVYKSNLKHNNKYSYNETIYIKRNAKVKIYCQQHGYFWQTASDHMSGRGCFNCSLVSKTKKKTNSLEFVINKFNEKHGKNTYDYSKVEYFSGNKNVCIICKDHGEFWQTPNNHARGKGCWRCYNKVSKLEIAWLDSLNIPKENRNKFIKIKQKIFNVDALTGNIVYEFYGDFWHGNPKKYNPGDMNIVNKKHYGELYLNTLKREELLLRNGYELITMWEHDWNQQNI